MALVADTSVLLAALDRNDPDHLACRTVLEGADEDLVVPILVLAELDYWCHERLSADVWLGFLEDVVGGAYRVDALAEQDLRRCHDLQTSYRDLGLGIVDASIVALLERLGEPKVATLDRRHFGVIRPLHVDGLELLP
jgi:predicted nucleic acid-binding protein